MNILCLIDLIWVFENPPLREVLTGREAVGVTLTPTLNQTKRSKTDIIANSFPNPSISIVPLILLRASGFIFGFAPPPRVETRVYHPKL